MALPLRPISVTAATVTLDRVIHRDSIADLNRAAGTAVTLPAATGTGDRYYVHIGTSVTSNTTTITCAGSDKFYGYVSHATTTAGAGLHAGATGGVSILTQNGTTTGGLAGSYIELVDDAAAKWIINAHLVGSGALATSLS